MTQIVNEVSCCDECLFSYDTIRCEAANEYFSGQEVQDNDKQLPPPMWCPLRARPITVRLAARSAPKENTGRAPVGAVREAK